VEEVAE